MKCWLKNIYNGITTSQKDKPSFYWKGLYKCCHWNCKNQFKAFIKSKPVEDGFIEISWSELSEHNKLTKPERLTGEKRESIAKDLIIHSTKFIASKNFVSKRHERNVFILSIVLI